MTQSTYIGDGVYAVQEGGAHIILIVPAGASPNGEEQRIVIDYYTGQSLTNYLERVFGFSKSDEIKKLKDDNERLRSEINGFLTGDVLPEEMKD